MNTRAITLLLMCGMAISAGAQTMYDALNYSENNYYGTARTIAMGNAFTALGGDLGSLNINPAGSAVANYSQVTLTPALNIAVNNALGTSMNGIPLGFEKQIRNSLTRFTIPNIGFTLNFDTHNKSGLKNLVVGFVMNGTSFYNDNMQAKGSNPYTSFAGALAVGADGIFSNEFQNEYPYDYLPWDSVLAWDAGIISNFGPAYESDRYVGITEGNYFDPIIDNPEIDPTDKNDPRNYVIRQAGTLDQNYGRAVSGKKYDFVINLGMNFSDKFYAGANIGLVSIDYRYQDWFKEAAQVPENFEIVFDTDAGEKTTYFNEMEYKSRYEATGFGIYGKFGFIARPVDGLRVGAAIQTPTSTTIKEYWESSAATYYTDSGLNASASTPQGEYQYRLISPFRFNVGIAYTFGSYGLISADYEMCDYSGMKFKEKAPGTDNSNFDDGVNADIRSYMGISHMLRAGAEIKPLSDWAIRAGYNLTTSPEKSYDGNDILQSVKAYRHSFSAGLGYSSKGSFFADLAFRATKYADEYVYPYIDYSPDYLSPEILNRKWMYDIVLTLGLRF